MTCFRLKSGETMMHYCKRNGLCYQKYHNRCDSFGMTPDEAIALPPIRPKNTLFLNNGELLAKTCKKTGVSYTNVVSRHKRYGESIQEAYDYCLNYLKKKGNK